VEPLPASGGMARFEIISTTESSAIVGSAHDAQACASRRAASI
jgi:hypothetical protein